MDLLGGAYNIVLYSYGTKQALEQALSVLKRNVHGPLHSVSEHKESRQPPLFPEMKEQCKLDLHTRALVYSTVGP